MHDISDLGRTKLICFKVNFLKKKFCIYKPLKNNKTEKNHPKLQAKFFNTYQSDS